MPNLANNIPPMKVGEIKAGDKLTGQRLSAVVHAFNRLSGGVGLPSQRFRKPGGGSDASNTFDTADVVATANIASLTGTGSTIDGHTVAADDVILLTAQTTTTDNGLWVVPASGAWTQQTPTAQPEMVAVILGTVNALSEWLLTDVDTYTQIPIASVKIVSKVSTTNLALTGSISVDGGTAGNNSFLLATGQTTTTDNGVYKVQTGGAWIKQSPLQPTIVFVTAGTNFQNTQWIRTATDTYKATVGVYG